MVNPNAALGVSLMIGQGVMMSVQMAMAKVLRDQGWPFYIMTGICCFVVALLSLVGLWFYRVEWPRSHKARWVQSRGFFGFVTYFLASAAVQSGTPVGDVSALMSINIVVSALLGRLFLGEPLGLMHILAVTLAFTGAVLISDPRALLGLSGGATFGIGYILAPLSGISNAFIFISSRKSAGVSPGHLVLAAQFWSAVGFLALPLTPFLPDGGMGKLVTEPWALVALWLVGMVVSSILRTGMLSAGAQLCPAAASATVGNAAGMISGYLVQMIFFETPPQAITLAGAGLMLASIGALALARRGETAAPLEPCQADTVTEFVSEDDGESLASFIASEVSEYSFLSDTHALPRWPPVLRLRRPAAEQPPAAAQVIGAALSVLPGSA